MFFRAWSVFIAVLSDVAMISLFAVVFRPTKSCIHFYDSFFLSLSFSSVVPSYCSLVSKSFDFYFSCFISFSIFIPINRLYSMFLVEHPCENLDCRQGEECIVNRYNRASCNCPSNCQKVCIPAIMKNEIIDIYP